MKAACVWAHLGFYKEFRFAPQIQVEKLLGREGTTHHESSISISSKASWKVMPSGFRDDIIEGEQKTRFPNFTLLNPVKEYDLLTDWVCTEPSMQKALRD